MILGQIANFAVYSGITDRNTQNFCVSLSGFYDTEQGFDQGGLACAVGTEETEDLAGFNGHAEVLQRFDLSTTVIFGQPVCFNCRQFQVSIFLREFTDNPGFMFQYSAF